MRTYYVYILTNKLRGVLYTGITSNLEQRIYQHQHKLAEGFTKKYNVSILVYYDTFSNPEDAIEAEKKIKGWTRAKKLKLIKSVNPALKDLLKERDPSSPGGLRMTYKKLCSE